MKLKQTRKRKRKKEKEKKLPLTLSVRPSLYPKQGPRHLDRHGLDLRRKSQAQLSSRYGPRPKEDWSSRRVAWQVPTPVSVSDKTIETIRRTLNTWSEKEL